jgi:hypothetical protein
MGEPCMSCGGARDEDPRDGCLHPSNHNQSAALPYRGTEGYAGSDTSRAQAIKDVISGTASKRQRFILILAQRAKERGITVADVRDSTLHHGRVSGALSVLHKVGKLARLTEVRDKCKVYVLPEFVNDRPTEPHGVIHKADKETLRAAALVEEHLRRYDDIEALFDITRETDEYTDALWRLVLYAQGKEREGDQQE